MSDLRITKLERDPLGGFWRARVSANGDTVAVDRRYGSWMAELRTAPRSSTYERRDVLPHVAAELQRHVRPLERAERKATNESEAVCTISI